MSDVISISLFPVGSLYLVQEFLAVESLRDYFELKPETQTKQSENIFKFAMDIVKGMSFLSKYNVRMFALFWSWK